MSISALFLPEGSGGFYQSRLIRNAQIRIWPLVKIGCANGRLCMGTEQNLQQLTD